jgi:hypothetical protein
MGLEVVLLLVLLHRWLVLLLQRWLVLLLRRWLLHHGSQHPFDGVHHWAQSMLPPGAGHRLEIVSHGSQSS